MSKDPYIGRGHVIKAIQKIGKEGMPWRKRSKRYHLIHENNFYPPNYVLLVAREFADDEEYLPSYNANAIHPRVLLESLGFTIVEISDITYEDWVIDEIVYEFLFHSRQRSYEWLDEHILELNPKVSRGSHALALLNYIGLNDKHKWMCEDLSIDEAINLLEQHDSEFSLVIQSLQRYEQRDNVDLDRVVESASEEYIELESIVTAVKDTVEVTETEREQVIKSRIGQSTFKKALLDTEKKCKLCGVSDERFLVASHIKPWSQSNNQERLDVNNGLLLCPNHDLLFDKGYISFDADGTILISDGLDEGTRLFLNVNKTMHISMNEGQQQYMKWHRENVF
ncbi:HNH endonuclease [Metabacillus rhizolycopersici]|uniref:HNH endonuclease n=1 Tax=Metabacillus rhizolycopersici TaxID=2875709 RepID=A0ABS7UXL4_9BACI|nr:HNH endonuclease [Metabacillus rhizolycopersici]MBZ5753043.1 HNH endonuclease [Metabacillus rhizolycopersici]